MVKSVLMVGIGGFIGTILRFLIARSIQSSSLSLFPWSTILINTAGCLLIGIIYGLTEKGAMISPQWRLFLTVGICGGFTTFSTFSNDTLLLMNDREWLKVSLYASMSFVLGLAAVFFGRLFSKLF